MYVNFIRDWRDLQFTWLAGPTVFEKLFHGSFYSQSFCQNSAERKSPKKYFFIFNFYDWPEIRTQAFESNKPTHYTATSCDIDRINKKSFGSLQYLERALYECVNELFKPFQRCFENISGSVKANILSNSILVIFVGFIKLSYSQSLKLRKLRCIWCGRL